MYEYSKLRGKIVEKFKTEKLFSEALNISNRTLSLKLNNKVAFSIKDIETICSLLDINKEDISSYFFSKNVQSLNNDKSS